MAQHTTKTTPGNQPAAKPTKTTNTGRQGDEPQDLTEEKPAHSKPDAKDRGRDRNPGDMKRDENDQNETETEDEGLVDAADQDDEFEGEDETDADDGSHMKNPQPRTR